MGPNDLADLPHFMGCLLQEYGQLEVQPSENRTGQDQTKTDDKLKKKHLVNPLSSHFSQLDK
ncbi:hypothetical protein E3U43_010496, partial [Larimichthys crocea]